MLQNVLITLTTLVLVLGVQARLMTRGPEQTAPTVANHIKKSRR